MKHAIAVTVTREEDGAYAARANGDFGFEALKDLSDALDQRVGPKLRRQILYRLRPGRVDQLAD